MKLIDGYDNFIIYYIAGLVTRSKVKEIKCQEYKDFLCRPGTKSAWIERKEFPECNLFCVNDDLQTFFKFTEAKLKPNLKVDGIVKKNFISNMVSSINVSFCSEFPDLLNELDHGGHKKTIIEKLCKAYVKVRLARFIKQRNLDEKAKFLRKTYSKLLHFKNQ